LLFGAQQLFELADGCDLLVNGDLFDTFTVPLTDMFSMLQIASAWLHKNSSSMLFTNLGNHDLAKNREIFSSFDFFTRALALEFPARAVAIRGLAQLPGRSFWVLSHVTNQDEFELELSRVPPCEYLAVHANYDNGFAAKSDHSLNLSRDQAAALMGRGIGNLIFGHEHQHKRVRFVQGDVLVVGNQMPSSVADCLGNDQKFAAKIVDGQLHLIETWHAEGNFTQMDWRTLADDGAQFIRVIGDAQSDEASAVVQAIAKFRQQSKALVITNAVQIAGSSTAEMTVSLEQVQNFNVMEELMKFMETDEQRAMIAKLMESSDV